MRRFFDYSDTGLAFSGGRRANQPVCPTNPEWLPKSRVYAKSLTALNHERIQILKDEPATRSRPEEDILACKIGKQINDRAENTFASAAS
jgi:hypothetical protein